MNGQDEKFMHPRGVVCGYHFYCRLYGFFTSPFSVMYNLLCRAVLKYENRLGETLMLTYAYKKSGDQYFCFRTNNDCVFSFVIFVTPRTHALDPTETVRT